MSTAVDVFAGPGGWDLAARELGIDCLGIEVDVSACATRLAANLPTRQGDVAALDPLAFGPVDGFIGSPPCPTFSAAGNGAGRLLTEIVVGCMDDLAAGRDTRSERRDEAYAALEPTARFATLPKPRSARKRAQHKRSPVNRARLIAVEKRRARNRRDADMSLLVVEPLRWILALRPEWIALEQVPAVLSLWQHMAWLLESEGYGSWAGILEAERMGVPQTRERAFLLAARGRTPQPPRATHQRYVPGEPRWTEPMLTLEGELLPWVSMADALSWSDGNVVRTGDNSMKHSRNAQDMVPYERPVTAPASTVDGAGTWKVGPPAVHVDPPMRWKADDEVRLRRGQGMIERHGDFQPGGHHAEGEQSVGAVRVTVEEAAAIQTFPPDYPWQGTRGQQFTQVGNACPPLLSLRVLEALLEREPAEFAAINAKAAA